MTPEISGLGSWTNDAGTFGVSAFGSVQEREYSNRTAITGGSGSINWRFPFNQNISAYEKATVINPPGPDQLTGFPNSATYTYAEGTRERTNAMVTLQWAPSDRMTITGDGMIAQNDQSSWNIGDLPFWLRQFDFVVFDDHPAVSLPVWLSEVVAAGGGSDFSQAGKELPFRNGLFELRDELSSFGLNFDYQINDSLTLNVDVSNGRTSAGGNHPSGSIYEAVSPRRSGCRSPHRGLPH